MNNLNLSNTTSQEPLARLQAEKGKKRNSDSDEGEPKRKVMKSEIKLTVDDEELLCIICSELFIKAVTLSCSHTFCNYCINNWRRNHTHCPICRAKIKSAAPALVIDNLVGKIVDNSSEEIKRIRAESLQERAVTFAALPVNTSKRSTEVLTSVDEEVDEEVDEYDEWEVFMDGLELIMGFEEFREYDEEDNEEDDDGEDEIYNIYY